MKVRQLEIENFRGVRAGKVVFADNTLLVGGNNVGKSTVCEALDLVLGPERTSRRPVGRARFPQEHIRGRRQEGRPDHYSRSCR